MRNNSDDEFNKELSEIQRRAIAQIEAKAARYAVFTDALYEIMLCQAALAKGERLAAERANNRARAILKGFFNEGGNPVPDAADPEWSIAEHSLLGVVYHEQLVIHNMLDIINGVLRLTRSSFGHKAIDLDDLFSELGDVDDDEGDDE